MEKQKEEEERKRKEVEKQNEDDKPWHEKVNDAMIYAYKAAKHKFNKECGNIVKRCVCDILGGVIINKVIEMIIKTVGELIKTLTSVIPEAIKEMIDLESMAKNDEMNGEGIFYDGKDSYNAVYKNGELIEN